MARCVLNRRQGIKGEKRGCYDKSPSLTRKKSTRGPGVSKLLRGIFRDIHLEFLEGSDLVLDRPQVALLTPALASEDFVYGGSGQIKPQLHYGNVFCVTGLSQYA